MIANTRALIDVSARLDMSTGNVRYFARTEGSADDEWVEINADEFERVSAWITGCDVSALCGRVDTAVNKITAAIDDFTTFRQDMEKLAEMARPKPPTTDGKEN